jgi:hypothetical protein
MKERERDVTELRVQLLEGRRAALDASMWQVPALIVAGQAFLLQVLTDKGVGWWVAAPVAAAGALASVTAGLALWQQRDRELLYSNAVKDSAGVDVTRRQLEREHPPEQGSERHKWRSRPALAWLLDRRTYPLWLSTLALFVVADAAALIATRVG